MKITNFRSTDQSGMASFLVVSVIVVLVTLLSLGFIGVASREERQALDHQLSDEAYYAAESGLNDAIAYLTNTANPTSNPSNCNAYSGGYFGTGRNVDGNGSDSGKIRYSCLLIDTQPKAISFTLNAGDTKIIPININPLNNLYFSWQNKTYGGTPQPLDTTFGSLPQDLPQDVSHPNGITTDATGLLRIGLYPIPNGAHGAGRITNDVISPAAKTYFLYPNSGDGSIGSVNYPNTLTFVPGNCNTDITKRQSLPDGNPSAYFCNSKITGINSAGNNYYVSFTAKYQTLSIQIEASKNNNNLLTIPGVQATIDVTGVGNDVLRRVQLNYPFSSNESPINYGLQSMQAICKDFRVPVTQFNTFGSTPTPYKHGGAPNTDNMCVVPPQPGSGQISS